MRISLLQLCLLLVVGMGVGCAGDKAAGGSGGGGPTGGGGGGGQSAASFTGTGGQPNYRRWDAAAPSDATNNCAHVLNAVVRDFRGSEENGQPKHPDFEQAITEDRGYVAAVLGTDSKPVYAGAPSGTPTTTGKDNFDQWYRDVKGVNAHVDVSIPLTADPARSGVFVYDNDEFFPIDKMGLMDASSNSDHNHDFTLEMHFQFPYRGGEVFNFRGDDDVFVFINNHLAIDLGGIHIAETGKVDLNAKAAELGISIGNTYQMDVFYADRHCCGSTFHVETTLQCITNIHVD